MLLIDHHNTDAQNPLVSRELQLLDPQQPLPHDPRSNPLPTHMEKVWSYWSLKRALDGNLPHTDLDLMALRQLSKGLVLTRVLSDPVLDFQIVFCSEHIDARMSRSYANTKLSENLRSAPGSQIWRAYETVADVAKPLLVCLNYVGPIKGFRGTREIFMPLGPAPEVVSHILVVIDFDEDRPVRRDETRWYDDRT